RCRLRRPRGLHEHLSSRPVSLLRDAAVSSRPFTGLAYLWRQPEVAGKLLWRGKSRDVADRRQHRAGHHRADARDGHYEHGTSIAQRLLSTRFVELGELQRDALKLTYQAKKNRPLLLRKRQAVEPSPPGLSEQVAVVSRD